MNLRSGAGTDNEIVGKIPGGSLVDATNCSDWCEVEWQGKKGFAIATALDRSGRVPAPRTAARRAASPLGAAVVEDDDYVPIGPPVVYGAPGPYYYGYGYRPLLYGYRGYYGYGYAATGAGGTAASPLSRQDTERSCASSSPPWPALLGAILAPPSAAALDFPSQAGPRHRAVHRGRRARRADAAARHRSSRRNGARASSSRTAPAATR